MNRRSDPSSSSSQETPLSSCRPPPPRRRHRRTSCYCPRTPHASSCSSYEPPPRRLLLQQRRPPPPPSSSSALHLPGGRGRDIPRPSPSRSSRSEWAYSSEPGGGCPSCSGWKEKVCCRTTTWRHTSSELMRPQPQRPSSASSQARAGDCSATARPAGRARPIAACWPSTDLCHCHHPALRRRRRRCWIRPTDPPPWELLRCRGPIPIGATTGGCCQSPTWTSTRPTSSWAPAPQQRSPL